MGYPSDFYYEVPQQDFRRHDVQQMREAFQSAAEKLEIEILEMDGEADLVHVLIAYPPKLSISVLVNNLKSVSSRRVRILNTNLRKASHSGVLSPISPVALAVLPSKH